MSKKNKIENDNLSIALRKNLKLRKSQLLSRDEKDIPGKRIAKIGISNLIKKK